MAVDGAWRSPRPSTTAPSTAFGWISGFGSGSASVGLWLDLAFIHLDFGWIWLDLGWISAGFGLTIALTAMNCI